MMSPVVPSWTPTFFPSNWDNFLILLSFFKIIAWLDVKRYKKGVDAVMDLKNGAIDAVVIDEKPAQEFVKNNAKKLKLVVDSAGEEYYCIAITKGNTAYKEEINKQIKAIHQDTADSAARRQTLCKMNLTF